MYTDSLEAKPGHDPSWRAVVLLVVLGAFLFLPYLNKAFHVDDWVFLTGADRVLHHFDDPYGGRLSFFGEDISYYQTTHPPLYFLFLAGIVSLFGAAKELWLHLGNLIFPILAVFFLYRIAGKLGAKPFVPTLLFLTNFGFVVNAHNLMSDVPVLALGLGSVDLFLEGKCRNRPGWFIGAGVLALLTWLIGYQGLPFLGVLFLCALVYKVPLRRWWPALAVPVLGLVVWLVFTGIKYGTPHLFVAIEWPGGRIPFYDLAHIVNKLRANISYLGGFTFLISTFVLWSIRQRVKRYWLFFLLILSVAVNLKPYGYFPLG